MGLYNSVGMCNIFLYLYTSMLWEVLFSWEWIYNIRLFRGLPFSCETVGEIEVQFGRGKSGKQEGHRWLVGVFLACFSCLHSTFASIWNNVKRCSLTNDLLLSFFSASCTRSQVLWHIILNFIQFKARDPCEKISNLKNVKGIKGSKDLQLTVWSSIFWWYYAEYRWKLWVKLMCIHSFHMPL